MRLGNHERDRITDVACPVRGQREAWRHDHRRHAGHRHSAWQRTQLDKIGSGEHAQHAGYVARCGGIDARYRGVSMWRSHDLHPGLARDFDVFDVLPAPGQEARIFKPRQ